MAKISKTAQSVQAFITECKAHGFNIELRTNLIVLVSHFTPNCFDSFNTLNRNGVSLMINAHFRSIDDSNGVGADVALETGKITICGFASDRFFQALTNELGGAK